MKGHLQTLTVDWDNDQTVKKMNQIRNNSILEETTRLIQLDLIILEC